MPEIPLFLEASTTKPAAESWKCCIKAGGGGAGSQGYIYKKDLIQAHFASSPGMHHRQGSQEGVGTVVAAG